MARKTIFHTSTLPVPTTKSSELLSEYSDFLLGSSPKGAPHLLLLFCSLFYFFLTVISLWSNFSFHIITCLFTDFSFICFSPFSDWSFLFCMLKLVNARSICLRYFNANTFSQSIIQLHNTKIAYLEYLWRPLRLLRNNGGRKGEMWYTATPKQ